MPWMAPLHPFYFRNAQTMHQELLMDRYKTDTYLTVVGSNNASSDKANKLVTLFIGSVGINSRPRDDAMAMNYVHKKL